MAIRLDLTPLERIDEARRRKTMAEADLIDAVMSAREEGRSWEAIAAALGVSRQAAWEHWKHLA